MFYTKVISHHAYVFPSILCSDILNHYFWAIAWKELKSNIKREN
jgi:hypothetical protein